MPTLNYVVRPQDLYGYSIYDILLFSGLPFQHCIDEATLTLCNCVGKKIGKLVRDHFFTIISIRSDYSAFNSVFPFVRFFFFPSKSFFILQQFQFRSNRRTRCEKYLKGTHGESEILRKCAQQQRFQTCSRQFDEVVELSFGRSSIANGVPRAASPWCRAIRIRVESR